MAVVKKKVEGEKETKKAEAVAKKRPASSRAVGVKNKRAKTDKEQKPSENDHEKPPENVEQKPPEKAVVTAHEDKKMTVDESEVKHEVGLFYCTYMYNVFT